MALMKLGPFRRADALRCSSLLPALARALSRSTRPPSLCGEEQLLQQSKRIIGECSIPDQKACTVEQVRGHDWRLALSATVLRLMGRRCHFGADRSGSCDLFRPRHHTDRAWPHRPHDG